MTELNRCPLNLSPRYLMAGKNVDELSPSEIEAEVEELGQKIERLRAIYEQYFLGIEKRPPLVQRKDVVRLFNRLQRLKIKKSTIKYKLQQQVQKFSSLKAYWNRTEREIESGTYRRHTFKVKEREKRRSEGGGLSAKDIAAVAAVRDRLGDDAARAAMEQRASRHVQAGGTLRAGGAAAAAVKRANTDAGSAAAEFMAQMGVAPAPVVAPPPAERKPASEIPRGRPADEVAKRAAELRAMQERNRARATERRTEQRAPTDPDRAVFERFVAAKQQLNQSTDSINYEKMQRSLSKQREKVKAQHGVKKVDFDVVVKDGKAFLKPIPIKD